MKKLLVIALSLAVALFAASCEKPNDVFDKAASIAELTTQLTQMDALLNAAEIGTKQGQYTQEAYDKLSAAYDALEKVIADFQADKGSKDAFDKALKAAKDAIAAFTPNAEDLPFESKPAYLWSNSTLGYVDFGPVAEYVNFGEPEKAAAHTLQFTVEFWAYLPYWEDACWRMILGNMTEGGAVYPGGWCFNVYDNGKLRGVHNIVKEDKSHGWRESDFRVDGETDVRPIVANSWHHFAMVMNDKNATDLNDGQGYGMNCYLDGQKVCSLGFDADFAGYSSDNAGKGHTFIFARPVDQNGTPEDAAKTRDGQGHLPGSVKGLILYNKALTAADIADLYDGMSDYTDFESNVVIAWPLNATVEDSQNMKDATGKFTAKLCNEGEDFGFIEGTLKDGDRIVDRRN